MLNSCSLHLGYRSVQDMASQTNGLDTFRAVMSMHIIKVASDSQSLLMLFTPAEALAHISQTWCPAVWIWSYFFCKNELHDIAKSSWTHKRMSHSHVTISCDWNDHWKRVMVAPPPITTTSLHLCIVCISYINYPMGCGRSDFNPQMFAIYLANVLQKSVLTGFENHWLLRIESAPFQDKWVV